MKEDMTRKFRVKGTFVLGHKSVLYREEKTRHFRPRWEN
jgi:hypothetical protein